MANARIPIFYSHGTNNAWSQKTKKNILEDELAGEIESVGKDVKLFRECDQVYGTTTYR